MSKQRLIDKVGGE